MGVMTDEEMKNQHDKDCQGCATERQMRRAGGAFVRDYLSYCAACGRAMQGDTQHKVGGKDYHAGCVPADAPAGDLNG